MARITAIKKIFLLCLLACCWAFAAGHALAQDRGEQGDEEFGPVVRAYLAYLRNEREVVDDRVSRREISRAYYRRNSNRVCALREMAVRIARESGNDYLPELEAVASDELGTLFEHPPNPTTLRNGKVVNSTFRFLGSVRCGDLFYLFARLDPYEQAEFREKIRAGTETQGQAAGRKTTPEATRPRRALNSPPK